MSNKNLLKFGWNRVNEQDIKIIDSNALLEKKIKEANAALLRNTEEIPVDMVDGMDAFTVANLLEDSEVIETQGGEASDEEGEKSFHSNIIKAAPSKENPAAEEIEKELEEKLEKARQEADAIVEAAHSQAEDIRKSAHEQGKKKGMMRDMQMVLPKWLKRNRN